MIGSNSGRRRREVRKHRRLFAPIQEAAPYQPLGEIRRRHRRGDMPRSRKRARSQFRQPLVDQCIGALGRRITSHDGVVIAQRRAADSPPDFRVGARFSATGGAHLHEKRGDIRFDQFCRRKIHIGNVERHVTSCNLMRIQV